MVAAVTWAWYWRTHPTVFSGDGNGLVGATLPKGQELVAVGVTYPYPGKGEAVSIHSAAPRVVQNSADATFEFFVCTQDPKGWDGSALGIVFGASDFARYCPEPLPVEPGTDLDTGATQPQQLVMVLTVTKAGAVVTRGVDLAYSHGLQRGSQSVGTRLRIRSQ